jgi:hypothetical protein
MQIMFPHDYPRRKELAKYYPQNMVLGPHVKWDLASYRSGPARFRAFFPFFFLLFLPLDFYSMNLNLNRIMNRIMNRFKNRDKLC